MNDPIDRSPRARRMVTITTSDDLRNSMPIVSDSGVVDSYKEGRSRGRRILLSVQPGDHEGWLVPQPRRIILHQWLGCGRCDKLRVGKHIDLAREIPHQLVNDLQP